MKKDVAAFVASCPICQATKYQPLAPAGLLQPLPIPQASWEDLTMDFVTHLPPTNDKSTIMIIVDRLTKYAHFIPMPASFTAPTVASLFIKEVCKHHGIPKTIISDRDRVFMSLFWRTLFKEMGTELRFSTAHHPETDGQTEVTNRGLQQYLRCYTLENPKLWLKFLPWEEFSYNTAVHSAIGMSPFQALYGRLPPPIEPYTGSNDQLPDIHAWLQQRDSVLATLKHNLERTQLRMQIQANRHRHDLQFQVGDQVLLKLQPYRQTSLRPAQYSKLTKRFFGPFTILEKIGSVAYKLQLPPHSRIHPVFHISLLKPYKPDTNLWHSPLPPDEWSTHPILQPACILQVRTILHHDQPQQQFLVQWEHQPPSQATWIAETEFRQAYPDFDLADKVVLPTGEGNVTTPANQSESFRSTRPRKPPAWTRDYNMEKG